ncbi:mitochondrial ribosomal protein MRP51 [Xylaria intraflava]|nr:mitochondrial ribosomal protein MRP51 [Xylaria intraflava]
MASRSVSPGAALLRSSRLFSMPNPIPSSPGDYSTATKHQSTTATAPYPTHLTITTPSTSRVQGDWGLKRPLPLKTTTKQTFPLVRIRQLDSIEHITDFQSASDHTMTLKKFQGLNLPISVPVSRPTDQLSASSINRPKSVFEEDRDVTAIEPEQAQAMENQRWKFKGPWLGGMTDGEFNKWLAKKVRPRRAEFHAFLRETLARELTNEAKQNAVRDKLPMPPEVKASEISAAQFMDYIRDLRVDRFALLRHISRFLDLAPVSLVTETSYLATMKIGRSQELSRENPYSVGGPPITHPSAGISYLRTSNFLDNHPIYGPQKYHPMVKARVLKPRNPATFVSQPIIGLAGFVVDSPFDQKIFGRATTLPPRSKALTNLDLENPGGSKLYYKPDFASVDSRGKVNISVSDPPNLESELVAKEMVGENDTTDDVYANAMEGTFAPEMNSRPVRRFAERTTQAWGSRETYGFGLDKKPSA